MDPQGKIAVGLRCPSLAVLMILHAPPSPELPLTGSVHGPCELRVRAVQPIPRLHSLLSVHAKLRLMGEGLSQAS